MTVEAGHERGARSPGWLPWIVLGLVWLASVQVRPLLDPDEGRYAEIAREMVASGDWVTPRLDGLKYLEKPPLQYWATSALYSTVGLSEWTSRLWSVGLAFLCLPMVCAWVVRVTRDVRAGLAAGVALAVSPLFAVLGHLGLLDAGFTFWLTASLLAFTLAQGAPVASREELRWMLAAWLAAALAVLTKGIVVAALGGASLVIYSVLERDLRLWRRLHWLPGSALFLAVVAPWFILAALRNPGFLEFFFVHEHFTRFLTTVHHRVEPWWFFLPLLVLGVLPWLPALVSGVRDAWRESEPAPQFKPLKFLLIFAAVTLVFFSASGSKLPPYILPMLPPLAAITGVRAARDPRFFRGVARAGALLVCILAVGLLTYAARTNGYIPHDTTVWVSVALTAAAVAVVITWWPRERDVVTSALATAAAGALAWQGLLCAYAVMPPVRSARDLVVAAKPYIHPQTTLFSVGQYRETLSPYLERTLIIVGFEGELQFGLSAEPGKQCASPEEFSRRWRSSTDAVAFFDPHVWARYRREGLPGRVVAADSYTVAVSRS
jgi:4-amino-4-deoxy-L-arabinose transferase-like glycosyltransferase